MAAIVLCQERWAPDFACMLDKVLRGGDWELVKRRNKLQTTKQITKQTTRRIEFSDAFKTKIGSCPVRAANICLFTEIVSRKRGSRPLC